MDGWAMDRAAGERKKTHDGERKSVDLSHRTHVETLRWKTTGRAGVQYQCCAGRSQVSCKIFDANKQVLSLMQLRQQTHALKRKWCWNRCHKRDLKCMCLLFISGMFCHVVCAVLVYHLNCSKWPLFEWGQWRLHWCDDSINVSHAERINLFFSQSYD